MALDWLVRTCLAALAAAGCYLEVAEALAGLPPVEPHHDLDPIRAVLDGLRNQLPAYVTTDAELLTLDALVVDRAAADAAWAASEMTTRWAWFYDLDECEVDTIRVAAFDLSSRLTMLVAAGVAADDLTELVDLRPSALALLDRMITAGRIPKMATLTL